MKTRLLISFLLGLPLLTFCQDELRVMDFTKSVCEPDSDSRRQIRERIIDRRFTSSSFTIRIGVWAICCADFRPIAKLQKGTLFLDIEDPRKKEPCECGCYYQFRYQIEGLKSEPVEVRYKNKPIVLSNERYQTYIPLHRLVKSDTVDRVDKYGLKQGKWTAGNDSLLAIEYLIYRDGLVSSKVNLYSSGKIKSEAINEIVKEKNNESHYGAKRRTVEYYESGGKKKECSLDFQNKGICKEWDERGNLIHEGNSGK
jgi:hypothetical protein